MHSFITHPVLRPVLAAVVLSCIGVGTAECANVTATVVAVDAQTITVRQSDGMETTYDLQTGVTIPSRVEPGMEVSLNVENVDGMQMATSIQLTDSSELPATASSIWVWTLTGLLALAGATVLGRLRTRAASHA
jgi:hypothetical protein